ncbi:PspA-associated protein PspAA [Acidiphilium sp.]|jgi:hypothetical protein|uniref:PspA-associated protein PspAA n=1 Tax=Acidiphilium sp. TaxID=527 RepID=UPI002585F7A3|nr:hypothetical protein [Acidiphilium sp.]
MIIRIMGHGQINLADDFAADLTDIDNTLIQAVNADDATRFTAALERLHEIIGQHGKALPAGYLGSSGMIVPEPGTTLDEAHRMLAHGDLSLPGTEGASR